MTADFGTGSLTKGDIQPSVSGGKGFCHFFPDRPGHFQGSFKTLIYCCFKINPGWVNRVTENLPVFIQYDRFGTGCPHVYSSIKCAGNGHGRIGSLLPLPGVLFFGLDEGGDSSMQWYRDVEALAVIGDFSIDKINFSGISLFNINQH